MAYRPSPGSTTLSPPAGASLPLLPDAHLCSSCYLFLHCAYPFVRAPRGPHLCNISSPNTALSLVCKHPSLDGWTGPCGLFGRSRWLGPFGTCHGSIRLRKCPDFTDLDQPVQFILADVYPPLILPGTVPGSGDSGTILVPEHSGENTQQ